MIKKCIISILFLFILFFILLKNQKKIEITPNLEKLTNLIEGINSRNRQITSVLSTSEVSFKKTRSKLYYKKPSQFLLVAQSKKGKELEIGFNNIHYWFWIKNFDPKNLYYCKIEQVNRTNLKTILYPQVLSDLLGINELDMSNFDFVEINGNIIGTEYKCGLKHVIIFDNEKIIQQEYYENEKIIIRVKVKSFFEYNGTKIPKDINLEFQQEGISLNLEIKPEEINKEISIEIPSDLSKIELDYN